MRAVKHRQLSLLFPFLKWLPSVNVQSLQADFWAGLTGAIIVLPQGIAYAILCLPRLASLLSRAHRFTSSSVSP